MFVLREEDTFDWPVKAKVPQDGKRVSIKFMARFNILDQDTIDELVVNPETRNPKEFMRRALVKFWDLPTQDGDGNEITDEDEKNDLIIKSSLFLDQLIDAYASGVTNYRAKN